jgi:site-specific DNA recombinase
MSQCVAYCRVSTEEQASTGHSLTAQQQNIADWCLTKGFTAEFYVEAMSGKNVRDKRRPKFRDAVLRAKELGCPMVVYAVARLTRNFTDLEWMIDEFKGTNASLRSVTELEGIDTASPSGNAMLNMMIVFAKLEREQRAERTKSALDHLKRSGKKYTRIPPYGYKWCGRAKVKNPIEQKVMAALKLFKEARPDVGYGKLAKDLNEAGFRNRKGKRWNHTSVRDMMIKNADLFTSDPVP